MGKIQTVGTISQFMGNGGHSGIITSTASHLGFMDFFNDPSVFVVKETWKKVFDFMDPIFTTVQALSTPIATLIFLFSGIIVAFGLSKKASSWYMKTSILYIVIQFLPGILKKCIESI